MVDVIETRTNKITSTRKIGEIGGLVTRLTLSGNGDRACLVSEDRLTVLCTLTQDVIGTVMESTFTQAEMAFAALTSRSWTSRQSAGCLDRVSSRASGAREQQVCRLDHA